MATCPICLFANPSEATICTRCGKFRFPDHKESDEFENVEVSEMRTRVVTDIEIDPKHHQSSPRTIRGPMTVPQSHPLTSKSSVRASLLTVKATAIQDSDAYTVVPIETTPPPLSPKMPRLVVIRGEKVDVEFSIFNGQNLIGRTSEKPVDIDLTGQEAPDQIWSSRKHAIITLDRGTLIIEDLKSLNGTFVNRSRLHPGQQRVLQSGDVIQIGTLQFRVEM